MIACAWFPNWPIQRLCHARPELRGPVALHQHGKIVAASNANLLGVPAVELAIHVEEHDPLADRAQLESLALWCDQFSPLVGVEGDSLLIDIAGLPFDTAQFTKAIRQQGFVTRVVTAKTVGSAWALAHFDEPLPVASLRLQENTLELLNALGIQYVTELQTLPRDQLVKRFDDVTKRLDQFSGSIPELITPYRQPPEIVVARDLEYPLAHQGTVVLICNEMIKEIAGELSQRQQGAVRLELSLDDMRWIIGLFRPSNSAQYLCEQINMQLEQVRLAEPVERIGLAVLMAAPLRAQQRELFNDEHDRQRQLALFIDRIRCRSHALRAVLVADAQPEHAFRYERFTGNRKYMSAKSSRARRPLLIEPRPIPVTATPQTGSPQQFSWQGQTYRVLRASGPERILTGWWRGGYVRRDYYRVETTDGCYWLFRASGRWFLHGVF